MATLPDTTIDTDAPFNAAEYYGTMRRHGCDPHGTFREGKYWEAAAIDVGLGSAEFFTAWGMRGDPERNLRRAHIREVWDSRPDGATFVRLGGAV